MTFVYILLGLASLRWLAGVIERDERTRRRLIRRRLARERRASSCTVRVVEPEPVDALVIRHLRGRPVRQLTGGQ